MLMAVQIMDGELSMDGNLLRDSRYGHRGMRVAEASHPGPRLEDRVGSRSGFESRSFRRRRAGLSDGEEGNSEGTTQAVRGTLPTFC